MKYWNTEIQGILAETKILGDWDIDGPKLTLSHPELSVTEDQQQCHDSYPISLTLDTKATEQCTYSSTLKAPPPIVTVSQAFDPTAMSWHARRPEFDSGIL